MAARRLADITAGLALNTPMAGPRPDFLRPCRGPHPLAGVALAAALLVLAVAALDAWQAHGSRQTAQERLDTAQAMAARKPARAAVDSPQQRAEREALAQLQRPWPRVFESVESVRVDGVAWLALEAGEQGALRLEGQAPDSAAALAAAEGLRRHTHWREVLVARLDATAVPGAVRFSLVALPAEGAW